MPDRDKDLVALFVRDLDRIDLPPRERWRPAEREESIFMRTSRTILYAATLAAVLAVALLAGFAMRDRGQVVMPPTASPTPTGATATPAPISTQASAASAAPSPSPTAVLAGAITGRFSYGSDFIPPVTVYAISTADPRVWYSVEYPGLGNPPRRTAAPGTAGDTYMITGVAPGTYWVVAYRNDGNLPEPGYYSRGVVCACPDVSLMPVTVVSGQTTRTVDVITWDPRPGQPGPTIPPRPR